MHADLHRRSAVREGLCDGSRFAGRRTVERRGPLRRDLQAGVDLPLPAVDLDEEIDDRVPRLHRQRIRSGVGDDDVRHAARGAGQRDDPRVVEGVAGEHVVGAGLIGHFLEFPRQRSRNGRPRQRRGRRGGRRRSETLGNEAGRRLTEPLEIFGRPASDHARRIAFNHHGDFGARGTDRSHQALDVLGSRVANAHHALRGHEVLAGGGAFLAIDLDP